MSRLSVNLPELGNNVEQIPMKRSRRLKPTFWLKGAKATVLSCVRSRPTSDVSQIFLEAGIVIKQSHTQTVFCMYC